MDWTPWIGRRRPVEEDALRLLTITHQLGELGGEPGVRASVAGEERLQHLDHLVRQPTDLAFVLIDRAGRPGRKPPRSALAPVRRLLAAGDRSRAETPRLARFRAGSWQRWDDVLAYLACRDLLHVRPDPAHSGGLVYLLTDGGAELLERTIYPSAPDGGVCRERCRLLRDALADDGAAPELPVDALGRYLDDLSRRLDTFQREEQVTAEDDLLSRFFHVTLGEPL